MKHAAIVSVALLPLIAACSAGSQNAALPGIHAPSPNPSPSGPGGLSQIQHIVVIEMENRSFDNYFGTFPGANGIPANPSCNPDPKTGKCIFPYHDTALRNYGGPHSDWAYAVDLDAGKMDGFITAAESEPKYADPDPDEVMGYHTCAEIPTYCAYASEYTLADENFAATTSWSTMAHLYLVSGWSAICSVPGDPTSCVSSNDVDFTKGNYAWTDITWLLHEHRVTWGYFVYPGGLLEPYVQDDSPGQNEFATTSWNPMPAFTDVQQDGEESDVQSGSQFIADATGGLLPSVCWVTPPFASSDHPAANIDNGQSWVKQQVDAVMQGPDWPSTIILLTWDEWGGMYDHVMPPVVDGLGYGFRTPLIVIGPMVKKGYIDHQMLSSDAYLKLIEDVFLGGERIDSRDRRPDSRPDVRENTPGLGDLANDLQ